MAFALLFRNNGGGAGDHVLAAHHGEGHDRRGHHQQGRDARIEGGQLYLEINLQDCLKVRAKESNKESLLIEEFNKLIAQ